MRCPSCHADDDRVVDSRSAEEGKLIRRRRACNKCNRRFTTHERVETTPLVVIKKSDDARVPYEREKIRRGIEKACEKLSVSTDQIDAMINIIETDASERFDREVPSIALGELVMRELRKVNQVAYVRFASVYKEFKDVSEFMAVLEEFLKGKGAATLSEALTMVEERKERKK